MRRRSLSFHGARGEPSNDAALEQEGEDRQRKGRHHGSGGDLSPRLDVLAGEKRDGDRNGPLRRSREKGQAVEQLVAGKDEDEDGRRRQPSPRERQVDA